MNMHEKIEAIRKRLGKKLLILGHHYQRAEVIEHVDLRGDSFQLSAAAAEATDNADCETIVFCGVHFMAETADILANSAENIARRGGRRVNVVLPDPKAGCSMADMATRLAVETCWKKLSEVIDTDDIVPVTYVNSSAELKAFCGLHGGLACTSTNARAVLEWALSRQPSPKKGRVLFFPDQHLGRNTALAMGISEAEMPVWDGNMPDFGGDLGGNSIEAIRESRIILWNGYCSVHQKFTPEQIDAVRRAEPGIRVIVHPECCRAVVEKADESGSTSFIQDRIVKSPGGTKWAVGTEGRFVERLARENPDKTVVNLAPEPSFCETMSLIDLPRLLQTLETVEAGINPDTAPQAAENVVRVEERTAADALVCLHRMLQCKML